MASSDDALALAGQISGNCVYPRFADFITRAIMHCAGDAQPLSEEQIEQLYRASFEAGDGLLEQVAHTIDHQTVLAFMRSLDGEPDGS